jgi:hypothetical protein
VSSQQSTNEIDAEDLKSTCFSVLQVIQAAAQEQQIDMYRVLNDDGSEGDKVITFKKTLIFMEDLNPHLSLG